MRLDKTERFALEKALTKINKAFIFGSRIDDSKKGGDIDLLIYSDKVPLKISTEVATEFFNYCEEKIDVVVMNPNKITDKQKAFLNIIKMERIK